MAEGRVPRRLAAILSADVVGYSRLIESDEAGTRVAFNRHLDELIRPEIAGHDGRLVKTTGDGLLVEFLSTVAAVQCAIRVQQGMEERNAAVPEDHRIVFRIGVNLGDVIVEGDDIHGEGVNVAARLEGIAPPGGIVVSGSVYEQIRNRLDHAIADLGPQQVKNIAEPVHAFRIILSGADVPEGGVGGAAAKGGKNRRRIIAAVAIGVVAGVAVAGALLWYRPWAPAIEAASVARMALPLPDRPSIVVLPFNDMSADAGGDYFSDGMTEDLITDLSKISGLFVIARTTAFTYKGRAVKVRKVAEELGVRYVLEGSVRRAGDKVRINAQLIDATGGYHLWADRYDGDFRDVFALQDKVTRKIVRALAVTLTPSENDKLARPQTSNSEAYDLMLRGLAQFRRFTPETNATARRFFQRAADMDPGYARATGNVALTHAIDAIFGWSRRRDESLRLGRQFGEAARALDDSVREVYFALSNVYLALKDHDRSIAAARRSIAVDPNYADGYALLAQNSVYAGRTKEARAAIGQAMRLSPRYSFFYRFIVGHIETLEGNYGKAIEELRHVLERNPAFVPGRLMLVSALVRSGRLEDAKWEVAEVLTLRPEITVAEQQAHVPYRNADTLARYLDTLRKAGLPEGKG